MKIRKCEIGYHHSPHTLLPLYCFNFQLPPPPPHHQCLEHRALQPEDPSLPAIPADVQSLLQLPDHKVLASKPAMDRVKELFKVVHQELEHGPLVPLSLVCTMPLSLVWYLPLSLVCTMPLSLVWYLPLSLVCSLPVACMLPAFVACMVPAFVACMHYAFVACMPPAFVACMPPAFVACMVPAFVACMLPACRLYAPCLCRLYAPCLCRSKFHRHS